MLSNGVGSVASGKLGAPALQTVTVTNLNDSGPGSLREAIDNAPFSTVIDFAPNVTGTITLTTGQLAVDTELTINGPGARSLTVTHAVTGASRIFSITGGFGVFISGLTITGGHGVTHGGGVTIGGSSLSLSQATVSGNTAGQGGGIWVSHGSLTMENNTISNNTASIEGGGRWTDSNSSGTMVDNTISGNSSSGNGGGILNHAAYELRNNTIADNVAASGGGIHNGDVGTLRLTNNLIAANPGGDCSNTGTIISLGHNLNGDISCSLFLTNVGDIVGVNPGLGPLLQDNGGPTDTHALLSGSPAIDAGNDFVAPSADQRGVIRVDPNTGNVVDSDIGAFELQSLSQESVQIQLSPKDASNPVDTFHTVTATITLADGTPVVGVEIVFTTQTGPHAPQTAAATTNLNDRRSLLTWVQR